MFAKRNDQAASLLLEGVYDPGIFKVVFLAGGPGSGKSTAVRKMVFPDRYGLKNVNVDSAFELFLKQAGASMDMTGGSREERSSRMKSFNRARSLTKRKKENYIEGRLGLVIDGTGGSFSKIKKQKENLEALGYDTFMLYVDTTLDTAIDRNVKRGAKGGRRLRDEDLIRSWSAVNKNKEPYQDLFGENIVIVDGNTFDPKEISRQSKIIQKFVEAAPQKPEAKAWIQDQLQSKSKMTESLIRGYVKELLKEDAMGFVQDLAASDKLRYNPRVRGAQVDKAAGRDIKRAFNKNADHQFLSTLDTVHWAYNMGFLEPLKGRGKDELSTTMTLPGDSFDPPAGLPYGLWIKGRITLAANEQDKIYSGFYGDYGIGPEGDEEAITQRDRSSGRNKRPTRSKDYRKFSAAEKGNPAHEKVVRKEIPYILDQSTWDPSKTTSNNEALVDNWRPKGIIVVKADVADAILKTAKKLAGEGDTPPSGKIVKDIDYFSVGVVKTIMLASLDLGVPIYDADRRLLWSPK